MLITSDTGLMTLTLLVRQWETELLGYYAYEKIEGNVFLDFEASFNLKDPTLSRFQLNKYQFEEFNDYKSPR
uniref:Uncharacterized protein n=1 Tax=Lepeophtheirus salmonis TaxID=72036 RepID=A0A0K2UF14_LEPSM